MRTLNIAISDLEFSKFDVDIISRELTCHTLNNCIGLSEGYGLASMTMDEISAEVKAVRDNAPNS